MDDTLGEIITHDLELQPLAQLSPDAFYDHCVRLKRSAKHSDSNENLDIVLSALDFDSFCDLMEQEAIRTQQAMKAADDMGL